MPDQSSRPSNSGGGQESGSQDPTAEAGSSARKAPGASSGNEPESSQPPRDPEIVREIGLDDYQPKGTMTLALIYFVIIVLMWIFMYFVEFAGNGPSILG